MCWMSQLPPSTWLTSTSSSDSSTGSPTGSSTPARAGLVLAHVMSGVQLNTPVGRTGLRVPLPLVVAKALPSCATLCQVFS
jgi:hypothetical protein